MHWLDILLVSCIFVKKCKKFTNAKLGEKISVQRSAISNQQSAVSVQQSAISVQQSAISCQQSADNSIQTTKTTQKRKKRYTQATTRKKQKTAKNSVKTLYNAKQEKTTKRKTSKKQGGYFCKIYARFRCICVNIISSISN